MLLNKENTTCVVGDKPCSLRCLQWCMLVSSIVNITALLVVYVFYLQDKQKLSLQLSRKGAGSFFTHEDEMTNTLEESRNMNFVVDTPGCRIPNLETRSPLILKYISDLKTIPKCSELWYAVGSRQQRGPPLVESNLTSVWVVRSLLQHYNVTNVSSIACCYQSFWRVQDDPENYKPDADNKEDFSDICIPFDEESQKVNGEKDEFIIVKCFQITDSSKATTNRNGQNQFRTHGQRSVTGITNEYDSGRSQRSEIYRDFHAFVPLKPLVEKRCNKIPHNPDEVSVLVLGIDSVSRLNMLRELPQLHEVLTSPPLSAISLLGYNKVGDNTFPNVIPLMTGLAEDELKKACPWPSAKHKLDLCPFIWKEFAKRGYRTAYGEDCTWMSSFNHERTGFVEAPTDYYVRPFVQVMENQTAHTPLLNANLCIGSRLTVSHILDYARKFAEKFAKERSFAFLWTSALSHDYLTIPHNGDLLYSELIQGLVTSGALERTVLVVLSDHGMRWGGIRETYQGLMEERLPFVYFSFPKWFKRRFPAAVANLRRNARRLTTPFDLHETLQDLLDPGVRLEPAALRARMHSDISTKAEGMNTTITCRANVSSADSTTQQPNCRRRGISLFLPVPADRTCDDAGIVAHFCTCQTRTAMSVDSALIHRVAEFVVSQLNSLLKGFRQCAQLQLASVRGARQGLPLHELRPEGQEHTLLVDYSVTLETQPGGGLFEATVREIAPPQRNVPSQLRMAGPVSRLNLYGDQSRCVADTKMKLYCYC